MKETLCGIILTHVDDFLHCGNELFEERVMTPLTQRFIAGRCSSMNFKYIGLSIVQDENREISLDQNDYACSIEEPQLTNLRNNKTELSTPEYSIFRALVGALNWLMCGSRPDIAFDVIENSSKFKRATKHDLF